MTVIERSGFAAIVGRPNVGKSTLINRIIGRKTSIVSHRKQTTRSVVRAISEDNGVQIIWLDSPGWQQRHGDNLNRALNHDAEWAAANADAVIFVIAAESWTQTDSTLIQRLPNDKPVIGVINKIDLVAKKDMLLPEIESFSKRHEFSAIVPLSAKNGSGVEALKREVGLHLPPSPPLMDESNNHRDNRPFFFAELLREKMFQHLGDELPYKVGVVTEKISDDARLLSVECSVYVEKESQKRIIIGKGGGMLKKLATAARLDMQRHANKKVFLTVRARVADWRSNAGLLKKMQIGTPTQI